MDFPEACIICCEEFSSHRTRCVTTCGHDDICSICFLRIRTLNRDKCCPTCKADLEHVICLEHSGKSKEGNPKGSKVLRWRDFEIWGDTCGSNHRIDDRSGMFFTQNYLRDHVDKLWSFKCQVAKCGAVKRDIKSLKTHSQAEHQLLMCNLCIDNKQVFPSEQKFYTQSQYETHLRRGDGDGSEGHPRCDFCAVRYYDKTALFTHLHKDHYTCHLCEKHAGVSYKYYKDYRDLEHHFKKQHYFCDDPACIEKKFIVFWSLEELNNHTMAWHPFKNSRRGRLDLAFDSSSDSRGDRTSSTTSKFDAGVSGRATNGEWKIKVEERSVDPRIAEREDEDVAVEDGFMSGFESVSTTTTNAAGVEDYPSLSNSLVSSDNHYAPGMSALSVKVGASIPSLEEAFPTLESTIGPAKPIIKQKTSRPTYGSSMGTESQWKGPTPEPTFGGIKIKEDKKAKKKQEAYVARVKLEEEKRKKFSRAVDGASEAMDIATGKSKADFASLSRKEKTEKSRPSEAPSSVTLAKGKPAQVVKSLGSKKRIAGGAGGGLGMQSVFPSRSSTDVTSSTAWTSIGSKGLALAPGSGGICRSSSASSFGSGPEREGEKVASSLSMGLGDFLGGIGASDLPAATIYGAYDEEEEIANAVRAIDLMSERNLGVRAPMPEVASEITVPLSNEWQVSGGALLPPPGLDIPVHTSQMVATKKTGSMAQAVASGQATKKKKIKPKEGGGDKKSNVNKVSKKTKKELQNLMFG